MDSKISDEHLIEIAKLATNRMLPHYGIDDFDITRLENSVDVRFIDDLHTIVNVEDNKDILVYDYSTDEPKIERRVQNQYKIFKYMMDNNL